MGFFELQNSSLPTIPWKQYTQGTQLDENILWTIRTAVFKGDDLNLPRSIGKNAQSSIAFAEKMLKEIADNGIVIYYPYFIADKSGTLNIFNDYSIIEAVTADLWNLVTFSDRNITLRISIDNTIDFYNGDISFLTNDELRDLVINIPKTKSLFRDYLTEGKSILLEWSFAYNCDVNQNRIGEKYLVFYEARTV